MKAFFKATLFVFLVGGLGLFLLMYRSAAPDKFILIGGTILTMDPDNPVASAVLVEDGRIRAVGTQRGIEARAGFVETVDLDGAIVLPGLIEPHTHPVASALLGTAVDISGFRYNSRAAIMEVLEDASSGFTLTPWIVAYGWDPLLVADLEPPTLAELDALSPKKPLVILTQMLHEAYVNSAALKAAGINVKSPGDIVEGFIRDDAGNLTGTVREVEAIDRLISRIPLAPDQATELLLRFQYIRYSKAGYTTIGVAGAVGRHKDPVELIRKVADDPESPLRTYLYLLPHQDKNLPLAGSADFRIKGIKFWMDGSPFTGGAALEGSYENSDVVIERLGLAHNHSGSLNYTRAEFERQILAYHNKGYQIAIHVQGERAIDAALDAIEMAQTAKPAPALRHRLEHNALITVSQMARAAKLGVTTGFFVDHLYYYGDVLPSLMGEKRMKRYMPLQSALEAGLEITVHGDHPATSIDPFRTLKTAIERTSFTGKTVSAPNEKISRQNALRAMTLNAAIQLGEGDELGSIEEGKRADFTVLSDNPLEVPVGSLQNIRILDVWKEGRRVDNRYFSGTHLSLAWDLIKAKLSGR